MDLESTRLNYVPLGMKHRPRLKVPLKACECHSHIYGPEPLYPFAQGPNRNHHPTTTVAEYRAVLDWLGIERAVIVQPVAHGTDNRRTIDAIQEFGPDRARGIANCTPDISDRELVAMNAMGIRGVRISGTTPDLPHDKVAAFAKRIAPMGWHIQFQDDGARALEWLPLLRNLPVPVVIDHIARMPVGMKMNDPNFTALLKFLEGKERWLKISGPYYGSAGGPPYADVVPRITALAEHRPDRLVWALNWPHPGYPMDDKPDPVACIDILLDAVPNEGVRNAILADNATKLYGFRD